MHKPISSFYFWRGQNYWCLHQPKLWGRIYPP